MGRKKAISVLIGCIGLFFAALIVMLCISKRHGVNLQAGHDAIAINEVLASNHTYPAPNGKYLDCVELCNLSDEPVDISGYVLTDHPNGAGYVFPDGTVLQGGAYILCWCDKTDGSGKYGSFGISADGIDIIYLYNTANVCIDSRPIPDLPKNHTAVRLPDGSWASSAYATLGFSNDEAGYAAYLKSMDAEQTQVVISEVMTDNGTTVLNDAGEFCDWVELHNMGKTDAVLDGWYLSDDPAELLRWQIPSMTLKPDEKRIICCSATGGQAPFGLSKDGCTVTLTGSLGQIVCQVRVPQMEKDRSYALQLDGSRMVTMQATPAEENTQQGYDRYLQSCRPLGKIAISEVMASNSRYLQQSDGEYYDWVELYNRSDEAVALNEYSLSNDKDERDKCFLPDVMLQPYERIVVICSGESSLKGGIQAPFTLSREECRVYLYGPDGLSDRLLVYDTPLGGSMGRQEGHGAPCYFTEPTPDAPNGQGCGALSNEPRFLAQEGVYTDVSELTVELEGRDIRYTLDGSVPTWDSPMYDKPIVVTAPTVIRAASFDQNKLPSETVTASYLVGISHELPVISLAVDPQQMFGSGGMYRNYKEEREIPCNLKLFEEESGFSVDCGIKMHGHTGLTYPKKSFKVNFRSQYGQSVLSYPVFGEDSVQLYSSLCIRAGQDYPTAIFRDELFADLCRRLGDHVLTQQAKFCVMYVNGEYFGIYCLKEAFSETYYAEHKGVSPASVTVAQAPVSPGSEFDAVLEYCRTHDLSVQEHYDHVANLVDIDAMIDWMIIEGYSCNSDIQQNLRYFKSAEDGGKWIPALYDLDWTFYSFDPFYHVLCASNTWQHTTLTRALLQNSGFREKFLSRLSWAMEDVLSDENVLAYIDHYEQLLDAEVPRERQRWDGEYEGWVRNVEKLREFVAADHSERIVDRLKAYIGLTQEEARTYFGRWA